MGAYKRRGCVRTGKGVFRIVWLLGRWVMTWHLCCIQVPLWSNVALGTCEHMAGERWWEAFGRHIPCDSSYFSWSCKYSGYALWKGSAALKTYCISAHWCPAETRGAWLIGVMDSSFSPTLGVTLNWVHYAKLSYPKQSYVIVLNTGVILFLCVCLLWQ